MEKTTGQCTPEQFWANVAAIGWGTKTTDCDAVKRTLLVLWDDEFNASFQDRLHGFEDALRQKVEEYEEDNDVSCECGDDGFGDLLSHCVGLGKEYYELCLEEPEWVVSRGQRNDYTDLFSSCFPAVPDAPKGETLKEAMAHVRKECERCRPLNEEPESEDSILMQAYTRILGDRADKEPRYFGAWARESARELEALLDSEFGPEFGKDLIAVVSAFAVVAKNEPDYMVSRGKAIVKALERIEKRRREILAAQQARLASLKEFAYWSYRNMVTDIVAAVGGGGEE